jgi:hypothetical protein
MGFQVGNMPADMMQDYVNRMQGQNKEKTDRTDKKKGASPFDKAMDKADEKKNPWERDAASFNKAPAVNDSAKGLYTGFKVQKTDSSKETDESQLSEKAQKLLKELREKYGNMDFFIANASSEAEAHSIMSKSTKDYGVLIDPDTLEKMAEDEDFKNTCLKSLEESTSQVDAMFEELGEDADRIESISIKINTDGTTEIFAKLRENTEAQRERIEKKHEEAIKERREEKGHGPAGKTDEAEDRPDLMAAERMAYHGRHRINEPDEDNILRASSVAELMDMLKERGIGVHEEETEGVEAEAEV